MPSSDITTEAFQRALRDERRRNARIGRWVRFVSVSLFLVLILVCGTILDLPAWQGHFPVFLPYWLLSLALVVVGGRSDWLQERSGVAIALLDMPVAFVLVREFVSRFPEHQDGPATFGLALFMYLIILVELTLDLRHIVLAAVVAAILAALLQVGVDAPAEIIVMCVMLVGLTAAACASA